MQKSFHIIEAIYFQLLKLSRLKLSVRGTSKYDFLTIFEYSFLFLKSKGSQNSYNNTIAFWTFWSKVVVEKTHRNLLFGTFFEDLFSDPENIIAVFIQVLIVKLYEVIF